MSPLRCSCSAPARLSYAPAAARLCGRADPFCEIHGDPLAMSRASTSPMSEELIAALVEAVKESDSP